MQTKLILIGSNDMNDQKSKAKRKRGLRACYKSPPTFLALFVLWMQSNYLAKQANLVDGPNLSPKLRENNEIHALVE